MKKKVVALLLAGLMALSLTACGEVEKVTKLIDGIGTVTLDSEDAIVEAENAYSELSEEDQEKIENYDSLVNARSEYDELVQEEKYNEAADLVDQGNYDDAIAIYESIIDYSDSADKITEVNVKKVEDLIAEDKYEEAQELITGIDDYANQEELVHYYNVCDIHLTGIDGLNEYIKENIPLNDSGDSAESVTVSGDVNYDVLVYYDMNDSCLKIEVEPSDSDNDGILYYTFSGDNSGEYELIYGNLQEVSYAEAYYSDDEGVIVSGDKYYLGYNTNAFGNVDPTQYKKGDDIEIADFKYTSSDAETAEARNAAQEQDAAKLKAFMNAGFEGLQKFMDNHQLETTLEDLGYPYASGSDSSAEAGDVSAEEVDAAIQGTWNCVSPQDGSTGDYTFDSGNVSFSSSPLEGTGSYSVDTDNKCVNVTFAVTNTETGEALGQASGTYTYEFVDGQITLKNSLGVSLTKQ